MDLADAESDEKGEDDNDDGDEDDDYIKKLRHGTWDLVWRTDLCKFQEFDRRLYPIHGAKYLDKLKKHMCNNGFPGMLILAIDKETMKCNLHDGNHRLTVANELKLDWVPVKLIQLSHGKDCKFEEVPQRPSLWPNYPCPCDFGFRTKNSKFS